MRSSNNYSTSLFCVFADPRETRRVDTYLSALFPERSRSYLQKMIESAQITANGESFTKNKKIYRGDVIEIKWKIESMELTAEDIPLDVVFENDDFAIINKDAGINTHPTPGEKWRKWTLVNALLHHFKTLGTRNDDGNLKVLYEWDWCRFSPWEGGDRDGYTDYNPSLLEYARENKKKSNSPEQNIWFLLRWEKTGYKFHRQKPIGEYIVNFYSPSLQLAIEIDGDSHINNLDYDKKRIVFLNSLWIHLLRYTNKEVLENLEWLQENIQDWIRKIALYNPSQPPLFRGGKQKTFHNFPFSGEELKWTSSIINGVERPGIVHRLDKDTSGLIIIAKNDKAMHALQLKIAKRTIQKTYLALVLWVIKNEEGYIESFIGRDPRDRKKMTTVDPVNPKLAKTRFYNRWVIDGKYTLLEVDLLTGRTHQIRVHLSSIWFPILGDKIYGNAKANIEVFEKYWLTRQWLHAYRLEFSLFGKDYFFTGKLKEDLEKMVVFR